ncbi:MAG: DUF6790 family protein [Desulfobacteraceae bacterium]
MRTFADNWDRTETLAVGMELLPLLIPLGVWALMPAFRRKGESILHLFAFFALVHVLYRAYCQVFKGMELAVAFGWPESPFLMELGAVYAAAAAALGAAIALQRTEWVKGILIALALYFALSAAFHLFDAFALENLRLAHVGPRLWHDILFVVVCFWVIRKAEARGRPIYYVPR